MEHNGGDGKQKAWDQKREREQNIGRGIMGMKSACQWVNETNLVSFSLHER